MDPQSELVSIRREQVMNKMIVAPPFHVQDTADTTRDGFPYRNFHDSISALWRTLWRPACARGLYPFTDAKVEDFDPIFSKMIAVSGDKSSFLLDADQYAQVFFPKAVELEELAMLAEKDNDEQRTRDYYLRAAVVYRIARFPINRSELSQKAWEMGKLAYLKGGRLLSPPVLPIEIPFTRVEKSRGDLDASIPAYLRVPEGRVPEGGWPLVLFICGLDSYRTDATTRTQVHSEHGFATLCFEIPGTGDCPAAPEDPESPDRIMASIFDWLDEHSAALKLNLSQVIARGVSTGGFYSIRAAHVHAERLVAAVAQGGSCHHMFDAKWIAAQNQMDYPFALVESLAYKFGYRSERAIAEYMAQGRRFSLLSEGILDRPSCRLLLIDGMEDSVFPIEDNFIVAAIGKGKDLYVRGDLGHMGNPGADKFIYEWLDQVRAQSSKD